MSRLRFRGSWSITLNGYVTNLYGPAEMQYFELFRATTFENGFRDWFNVDIQELRSHKLFIARGVGAGGKNC